jgi:hypothetical protein
MKQLDILQQEIEGIKKIDFPAFKETFNES